MNILYGLFFTSTTIFSACNNTDDNNDSNTLDTVDEQVINLDGDMASVISVTTSGAENSYTFNVGISSPDKGCDQYADWWEVITEDGTLLYRRILAHSHVNEQPFIRSGGAVSISSNQVIIIRAHMNTSGYGTLAFKGSVDDGFKTTTLNDDFAQDLNKESPLPNGCAF